MKNSHIFKKMAVLKCKILLELQIAIAQQVFVQKTREEVRWKAADQYFLKK